MQTNERTIATTILSQLGGQARLCTMAGARGFVDVGHGVQFRVGRNEKRVTHVRVTLGASDTYTVQFHNVRGANVKLLGKFEDIYADQLMGLFERETGMYLRL